MVYKERISNDIKDSKTKQIWEEIIIAFEGGGSDGIRMLLDKRAGEFLDNYDVVLEELKGLL